MPVLADQVEIVIGVDTHKHTDTAAVVSVATGAVLAEKTVTADPADNQPQVELADGCDRSRRTAGAGLIRTDRSVGWSRAKSLATNRL